MLDLRGLTPEVLRRDDHACLRWKIGDKIVETDFDRFRPIALWPTGQADALEVTWGDFGDLAMADQFFKITMNTAAATLPYAAPSFKTSGELLAAADPRSAGLPFAGAIFHMGRTGSTLVHRLLSRTGKVHSLSEVTILDRAVQLTAAWPESQRDRFLNSLLGAFRRPRRPNERYFVTKMTDAIGCTRLPLYRAAFPTIPWIFIYRDPVEVMVSILRRPTGNTEMWFHNRTHAAERLQMPVLADPGMWPDEFLARTLERFCTAALDAARKTPAGDFLAVDYSRLPDAAWETIAPHFGIALSERDREVMRAEARFSAKLTDFTEFRPDSSAKKKEATKSVIELAERYVAPLINEMKTLPQG